MRTLPLRAALIRGALVTAANWPVVLIDFTIESFYKLALTIPILGGALAVAAIVGTDLDAVLDEGVRATADMVIGSLTTAPVALVSFLAALAVVALGGELLMFSLKIGTLSVLVDGEREAGEIHTQPLRQELLSRVSAYSLQSVYGGVRRFGRRALLLALWFGLTDLVVAVLYLSTMGYGLALAVRWTWLPAWPLLVIVATTIAVVSIVATNLAYDLLRVIVVTDDCSLRTALGRLMRFVTEDSRQVVGIFSVIGGVMLVATAASILAAAGLAAVAWFPLFGLIVVLLQGAAWILRGLAFQYLSLATLAAYQTQYRRFSEERWPRVDAPTVSRASARDLA
jgi:hypothetical protein